MVKVKKAIILCSGGLDSVVTSYYTKKKLSYRELILLFFDYGQRTATMERFFAKKHAKVLGAKFIEVDTRSLGKFSTALINKNKKIDDLSRETLIKNPENELKKWYVPCRNTLFLVYALALAENLYFSKNQKYDIFVGFKHEGRELYPDTTKGFLRQLMKLQKYILAHGKFRIVAPLMKYEKSDLIGLGKKLGINLRDTYSCYIGTKIHCGVCMNCRVRQEAFYWANMKDPTKYEKKPKDYRDASYKK